MPEAQRRGLARYPCDLPVEVHAFLSGTRMTSGRLLNLSLGGALMLSADALGRGVTYFFRLAWKQTPLAFPGRVAWAGPRDHEGRRYGIQFNLTRDQEMFLRGIVESLRQAGAPPAPRPAREYW